MSKVKESELYFLVLHWLRAGPCQDAADALERELSQMRLLPTVPSIGPSVSPDYASLCRFFSHVPPAALRELVEECVHLHSDATAHPANGVVSVLEATGSLSYIPSVRTQLTPSTVIVPPPSRKPNFIQRFYQRECAYPKRPLRNAQFIDNLTSHVYKQLAHVKTIRGHRKAVYCVAVDKQSHYAITGADDGIIKIWNLKIGLLKMTCRGHLGEITDLKINCDETVFASCSTDGTSRVWSLEEDTLGHHVSAMVGHQQGVTFIAWSPVLPNALLSVSLDGTCRLWHTERGIEVIRVKPLGRFGHFYNREAFERPLERAIANQRQDQFCQDREEVDVGLTCCAFSPTGEHFSVSSASGTCFVWHWGATEDFTGSETWPNVSLPIELAGHQKSVSLLLFDHLGSALCTASSDGDVKIWKPVSHGRVSSFHNIRTWEACWSFTLPDPLPCPTYNNRRRKTTPECNQIAWSCDNQFVMAAYSCSVIMVWNATDGAEENILYGGHADSPVHVLEAHPTDPKLCFSAGYDGMLILWDIVNGRKITTLSSQDTHPGRWRWADPLQFVDGRFLPDGNGILVSDVAGQLHLYGIDGPHGVLRRTPYDQFFLYDYDKVIISDQGEPIDLESGEPQHIHRTRFSMVDITEEPYDPVVQEILLRGSDLALLPGPTDPPQTPSALLILPPTMSAALWLADETGLGQQATATRVTAAQQRQIALMQETGEIEDVADYLPQMDDDLVDLPEIEIEESDGSEYTPDEGDPTNSPLATRRSERIQTRTTDAAPPRRRRIPTRQNPDVADLMEISEDEEPEFADMMSEEETLMTEPEDMSSEEEVRPRPRPRRPPARLPSPAPPERYDLRRHRSNCVLYSPAEDTPAPRRRHTSRSRRAARRAAAAAAENGPEFASGRGAAAYQWLSEEQRPVGYYVPQMGDSVVYFSDLHREFCQVNPLLATALDLDIADDLRFAEPCEVVGIGYEIFRDVDLSPTVARVKLRLTDEIRFGDMSFLEVVIPPPIFGHEEFVVHQTLFRNAISHDWNVGDHCQVFYYGEQFEWWSGKIAQVREAPIRRRDLWKCEAHHRRYLVQWTEFTDNQPEWMSPWELAVVASDAGPSTSCTGPCLSDALRQTFIKTLSEARELPEAEHFRETLAEDTSFFLPGRTRREVRTLFYNQVVALPISLKRIEARLKDPTYYISLEAFKHDLHLIVVNAHTFTEPNSAVSKQADALEQFILQSVQPAAGTASESSESSGSEVHMICQAFKRVWRLTCVFLVRRRPRIVSHSYATRSFSRPPPPASYQIRTRGMAKRERTTEANPIRRTTRRRRYV